MAKEYERELTAVRKLNAEKLAKHQQAIEAAKDAEKNAATELEFVRRDLFEEAEKNRSLKKAQGRERGAIGETVTTPKKNKSIPYRDGFDDDEVQIISPSKFNPRKSNPSTPTKTGTKRKRKGQDSPVVVLEVEQSEPPPQEQGQPSGVFLNEVLLERIRKPDDRLIVCAWNDSRPHKRILIWRDSSWRQSLITDRIVIT